MPAGARHEFLPYPVASRHPASSREPPYDEHMAVITRSVRDFLATGPLGHLVTLNPDGSPYITLTWAGLDGDELAFATFFPLQRKIDNLKRDPRVTVSFQANEHTGPGLHPYLVVSGRVTRISDGGALALMDALAEHYIATGATYPQRDFPEGAVIHVAPERVYGIAPQDGTPPGRRWTDEA
jgi:PPOX class probable F420-dependent enzyme